MFANTQMMGTDAGFPDVCLTPTPGGPVPVPYPYLGTAPATSPKAEGGGGLMGMIGGMLGGLDPTGFLSMMGGGETDAPEPSCMPRIPSPRPPPGMQLAPSALRVLTMSP